MTQSVLKAQLAVFIRAGKTEALRDYLLTLRNADFRLSGTVLTDKTLWADADFWDFATVLVAANSRAFLGTMLKAAIACSQVCPTTEFAAVCLTDIDKRKVLETLMPQTVTPTEINDLFVRFHVEDTIREMMLFKAGTAAAYFVLFNHLKQHEDDLAHLRRFGVELIRKGDKRSFNLACILKEYFGLPELPGTFSLSLQPYELSRLDTSFDTFLTIINR